jgi:dihydrofolate synthase/folylpolyglutamate synthase
MTNNTVIRDHLFSLTTRGIKYDLDRMREAAFRRWNPQNEVPCFHVAGTNGKGSICAYLESALRSCGKKTGLFTSPHLVNFEERFMINGRPIVEGMWLGIYHELRPIIDDLGLTFFEATTLMAFEIFKREKVEWAVFETGLGGRLDATNIVVPKVSVISSIAMDHMEYLGPDLVSIAGEKLGIVKKHVPLIMAEPVKKTVRALAEARCREMDSACTFVGTGSAKQSRVDGDGTSFEWDGRPYRVNLKGTYQLGNAVVALQALKTAGFIDYRPVAAGLKAAKVPGRFQIESIRGRTVIFDVGHNPGAAQAFSGALQERFSGKTVCLVTGIMKDKDLAGILHHYGRVADRLILTRPATERAAGLEDLEKNLPHDFNGSYLLSPTVASAVESALGCPEEIIGIAGSFFTVGEAMEYLGVKPYT